MFDVLQLSAHFAKLITCWGGGGGAFFSWFVCFSRVSAKTFFFRRWSEQNRKFPLCHETTHPAFWGVIKTPRTPTKKTTLLLSSFLKKVSKPTPPAVKIVAWLPVGVDSAKFKCSSVPLVHARPYWNFFSARPPLFGRNGWPK